MGAQIGDSLIGFAEGPANEAAQRLQDRFGEAAQQIAQDIAGLAEGGELDFKRMSATILTELARIAAEALFTRQALGRESGQTVNLNMALGSGSDAGSIIGAAGAIATSVARATALGARFI